MDDPANRPNFFILLGLDPDQPWDDERFGQDLDGKCREWSKLVMQNPTRKAEAQRNLDLRPEIEHVMKCDADRAKEAQRARAERKTAHDRHVSELDRAIDIACADGVIADGTKRRLITQLAEQFKDVATAEQIRAKLERCILAKPAQSLPPIAPAKPLDPAISRQISENLKVLPEATLYSFLNNAAKSNSNTKRLEVSQASSLSVLATAAREAYNQTGTGRPDAKLTAKRKLAGIAMDIFMTEQKRRQYDVTLWDEALAPLLNQHKRIWGTQGKISARQVEMFLADAQAAGCERTFSLQRIQELAKEKSWAVTLPSPSPTPLASSPSPAMQNCGNPRCGATNEQSAPTCRKCGEPFRVDCPHCARREVPADARVCPGCGFPIGDRFEVRQLVDEALDDLRRSNLPAAWDKLSRAQVKWTPSRADGLSRKVRAALAELNRRQRLLDEEHKREEVRLRAEQRRLEDQRQQRAEQRQRRERERQEAIDHAVKEIEGHIFEHRLFEAQRRLAGADLPAARADTLRARTSEGIQAASDYLARARQSATSGQQETLCRQALDVCADYEDAMKFLVTVIPSPPRQLGAQIGTANVRLTWDQSPSSGARYVVVRKPGSTPASPTDGQRLSTTDALQFDDPTPETGVPLYYAVFTERRGLQSKHGAVLASPVLFASDVSNLTCRARNGAAELTWEMPQNVAELIIVRKEGEAPRALHDGTRCDPADPTRLVDPGLTNGRRYFYRVLCRYRGEGGRLHSSAGLVVSCVPDTPPSPIGPLRAVGRKALMGYRVELSVSPPDKGQMAVLKSDQRPAVTAGDVVPAEDLRYDRVQDLFDTWWDPRTVVRYYMPAVIYQGQAYVGEPVRLAWMDSVTNLSAEKMEDAVRLRWRWPPGSEEALVACRHTTWPDEDTLEAIGHTVRRDDHERLGYFDLPGRRGEQHFIAVAPIARQNGDAVIGPCQRVRVFLGEQVEVSYALKTPGLFGPKEIRLTITPATVVTLPALALRARAGSPPVTRDDGEPVMELDAGIFIDRLYSVSIPRTFPAGTYGRLFLMEDADGEVIKLHHPPGDGARLG